MRAAAAAPAPSARAGGTSDSTSDGGHWDAVESVKYGGPIELMDGAWRLRGSQRSETAAASHQDIHGKIDEVEARSEQERGEWELGEEQSQSCRV